MPHDERWYNRNVALWAVPLLSAILGWVIYGAFKAGVAVNTMDALKADSVNLKADVAQTKEDVQFIRGVLTGEQKHQKVADASPVHRAE